MWLGVDSLFTYNRYMSNLVHLREPDVTMVLATSWPESSPLVSHARPPIRHGQIISQLAGVIGWLRGVSSLKFPSQPPAAMDIQHQALTIGNRTLTGPIDILKHPGMPRLDSIIQ